MSMGEYVWICELFHTLKTNPSKLEEEISKFLISRNLSPDTAYHQCCFHEFHESCDILLIHWEFDGSRGRSYVQPEQIISVSQYQKYVFFSGRKAQVRNCSPRMKLLQQLWSRLWWVFWHLIYWVPRLPPGTCACDMFLSITNIQITKFLSDIDVT